MSRIDLDNLNQEFYDVLREIGNIGAGNATTALAQTVIAPSVVKDCRKPLW